MVYSVKTVFKKNKREDFSQIIKTVQLICNICIRKEKHTKGSEVNQYLITWYVRKMALQNQGEHSGINSIETNVFLIDKNKIRFLSLFISLILK